MKFRIGEIGENAEAPQPAQDLLSHGPKLSGNEGKPPVLVNRSLNAGGTLNTGDTLNAGRALNAGDALRAARMAASRERLAACRNFRNCRSE